MRKLIFKIGRAALFLAVALCLTGVANAQVVKSGISTVTYTYSQAEFITLAPSTASVTIPSTVGATTAVAPALQFTTTYQLGGTHAGVNINVGFASTNVAFQGTGPNVIGSGSVQTSWNGGGFSSCNGPQGPNPAGPGNAACAQLNISSILNGGTGGAGSRTDSFVLEITGANTLIPDTYTGVISVQVVTN